jgi:hypothetical protein
MSEFDREREALPRRVGILAAVWLVAACGPQGAVADGSSDTDEEADAGPVPCATEGATECSPDGYAVRSCRDGVWTISSDCMRDAGRLCENAACVDPWLHGVPVWDTCLSEPRATVESLADKAEAYDALATRLHILPALRWLAPVHLRSGVPEAVATFADVDRWDSGENDGLWSALYLASQAYRYGATRDPAALATIRALLDGEAARMRITGVPGLFTRQMIPPGVDGLACPTDPAAYVPDLEKDDNRWVQIRGDGCVWVVDGATTTWTATSTRGTCSRSPWSGGSSTTNRCARRPRTCSDRSPTSSSPTSWRWSTGTGA